jgi:serine-type D-Ala-D-Ala carboxypeptidase (penicillin-binding protein 5/6)
MWRLFRPYQVGIVAAVLLVMAASHVAATDTTVVVPYVPETLVVRATPPTVSATAYAVFDAKTGRILAAEAVATVLPIASVTKLLTAATVLRTISPEARYTVTEADLATYGRAGRLTVGDVYPAHELLFPLLLESSNDAAAVIERETGGDILRRMNAYAKELGASTLNVTDASGLSSDNTASAKDLVALGSALYTTLPHVFDIAQLSKRPGPSVVWVNNSPVLGEGYRGGKHGFTEAAQRTLLAFYEEEFSSGTRTLGYVLLGSEDLPADMAVLRSYVATSVSLE